jgi:hypothetical protein
MTFGDQTRAQRHAALHARFLEAQAAGETERMTVEEFIERTGLPEHLKKMLRDMPVTRRLP